MFLFFLFSPAAIFSQTNIDRATYETERVGTKELEDLTREKLPEKVKKKEKPQEEAPVVEEGPKVHLTKIILTGCESFTPDSFSKLLKSYENKDLTIDELRSGAKEVEKEYLKRGVIATVFLPPQDVKEGVVTFQVVEAKMGRLEIQDSKYFKKRRLAYYWDIPEGNILRYDKLSKSLQIMNRNPDREIKTVLRAGKTPGSTDVALTSKTRFPAHFTSTFDNDGVSSSGKSRTNIGMRHNNFLGFDDTLIAGYSYGIHFFGKYFYHSVPISPKNTFITYGYNTSHSVPKHEFAPFGIKSDAENVTFSLHQELYNTEDYIGDLFAGFDSKDKVIRTSSGLYNKDRLRMFSLGGSYIYRRPGSVSSLSSQFYRGLSGLGASPKDNPYESRARQAKPVFSKLLLEFNHLRALFWNLRGQLKYRTQIAWHPLTPQEEFNLGGMDSVRGYPPADFLADNSRVVNLEILSPAFFIPTAWKIPYAEDTLRNQTTLVGFFDYGHGDRKGTMFGNEKRKTEEMSVGAGVRFKLFNQAALRLEWGYQIGEKPQTEEGKTRFHFSVNYQEQLPDEIERIRKLMEEEGIKKWAWQILEKELANPSSPLRKKLYKYYYLAYTAEIKNDLQQSREYYLKIILLGEDLYRQSENYVRLSLAQKKKLRGYKQAASKQYKEGDFEGAKKTWQRIIDEAKEEPLMIEF